MDKRKPQAFFNGVAQNCGDGDGVTQNCRGGATRHLYDSHYFHLQMRLGNGTNNFAELCSMGILICFP